LRDVSAGRCRLGTPAGRRVVKLFTTGITNRQAAQTLFLTEKTVETQLAQAHTKLGIRSRLKLPLALAESGSTN
jgi:DNA-binding NarL/FixJ family response regulator